MNQHCEGRSCPTDPSGARSGAHHSTQTSSIGWLACFFVALALVSLGCGTRGPRDPAALRSGDSAPCRAGACPNILIVIVDDLGFADLGHRGSWIQTPQIDALAASGIQLDRYYTNPICNPARAALMTGRSAIQLGIQYGQGRLSGGEYTLAERFRDKGYQTALLGKWSLSAVGDFASGQDPNAQGFDYFLGHHGAMISYFAKAYASGYDWWRNRETHPDARYATEVIGNEAVRFLRSVSPAHPFLLVVSFNAPHSPLEVPKRSMAQYRNRKIRTSSGRRSRCTLSGWTRCTYARMVEIMDDQVGHILDTLDTEGLAEDTIVVFVNDNGGNPNFGASNAPLRGQKSTLFEAGIRVPAIIRWQGRLTPGASDQFIREQDLFATLDEAAGFSDEGAPPLESQGVWKELNGAATRPRDFFFAVDVIGKESEVASFGVTQHALIEDSRWKLVTIDKDPGSGMLEREYHLFDILLDEEERLDLAEMHPQRVDEMAAKIERWSTTYPADGFRSERRRGYSEPE